MKSTTSVGSYYRQDGTHVKAHQRQVKRKTIVLGGKKYSIYKSPRKNKQLVAEDTRGNKVHFGDPNMKEHPNTKREDNFCARTFNQRDGEGNPTRSNPKRPNYFNRRVTWDCVGKKGRK